MRAQLIVAVVVIPFDGCVLDHAVHPLDLTVGPRVVRLGQSMLDFVDLADHVEAHLPRICFVSIAGLLRELDADIREDRVDAIGDNFEQMLQELPCGLAICLVYQLRNRKLAGPVNADEEVELAFDRLDLGDVDVEEADRVALELLTLRLVTSTSGRREIPCRCRQR